MEVKAIGKYVKVQPRKVRIVADEVRGESAARAAALLRFHKSKGAHELRKVLMSAVANAEHNFGLNADALKIRTIQVDEGPKQKRIQARAMGRAYRINKKTSHITVVVEEAEASLKVKHTGTVAKPRPTFAALTKGKKKVEAAATVAEEVVAPVEEPMTPAEELAGDAAPESTISETPAEPEATEPAAEATTENANEDEKGA